MGLSDGMTPVQLLEARRAAGKPIPVWALSWVLAHEVGKRFYASHGIVPWLITHSGLGYYGITLNALPCPVHGGEADPIGAHALGRFTMTGDVENWEWGSPGDHGCALADRFKRGTPVATLVPPAITHLRLGPLPDKSHLGCRHKRWGDSYVLCLQVAALLAVQHEPHDLGIYNHPAHTCRLLDMPDPKAAMHQHPGYFIFTHKERALCLAGDGRVLGHDGGNVWLQYMRGASAFSLAQDLAAKLQCDRTVR